MFGLILYTPDDFWHYIGVYVAIVTICSVAFFGFLLPKAFDYFNNQNYRHYKEMLDLRKSLIENKRVVNQKINDMIDHYEAEFLVARTAKLSNPNKNRFYRSAWELIGFIFIIITAILLVSFWIYQHLFLQWFIP